MDMEHPLWQVVKWVLVILAGGFIGQFGRHLARLILERRRNRRDQASISEKRVKEQAKLEKKRAKDEVKRIKKLED